MYTTGSVLGENHRHTAGLAGADFVMNPKKTIKKTGRETWTREHAHRQAVNAEGRNGLWEGKHFFKILKKNSLYLYQVLTVYISRMILFNPHNPMRQDY